MPLATIMRQMIEIGETEANLDEKKWSASLKFQTASESSTLVTAMISQLHNRRLRKRWRTRRGLTLM